MSDIAEESSELSATSSYSDYDTGYRARDLWATVFMQAFDRGQSVDVAADAADTAIARYKAKFDLK